MAAPLAAQPALTVEEIMARLAAVTSHEVRFTETAQRALLAEPEVQRGTLIRVPPAHLLRAPESVEGPWLLLAEGRLRLAVGAAKAEEAEPEMFSFFREFARLFEGDLDGLRERYELDFAAPEAGAWELELVPRAQRVRQRLERILLRGGAAGTSAFVTGVELQEAGGDRVRLRLSPVDQDRSWAAEQLEALFESRTLP